MTAHESFTHSPEFEKSSVTNFGYTFTGVFAVLALWPTLWHGLTPRPGLLIASALTMLVTLHKPNWLKPFNTAWFYFSVLLGKIMVPLTMVPIWLITILPMGLMLRLVGRDALKLAFDPKAKSYWQVRDKNTQSSMSDSF